MVPTQCDVGVGTVDAEAQRETHGESSEAQKADYATQCDFDSHEGYDLVNGQMALLTSFGGKEAVQRQAGLARMATMGCARRRRRGGGIDSHAELGLGATGRVWERRHKPHGAVRPWSFAEVPLTHGHQRHREYGI